MLAQERWGEDRYLPMVMLAQVAANSAVDCYELANLARKQSLLKLDRNERVTRETWQRLYRNPAALQAALVQLEFASEEGPKPELETEFRRGRYSARMTLRECLKTAWSGKQTQRDVAALERLVGRYYRRTHLRDIARKIHGEDEPAPPSVTEWLSNAECLFFMGIVVPCLLEYQVMPSKLYRAATQGDFAALEKLMRLDSEIGSDERIGNVTHRMRRNNAEGLKLLNNARNEGIKKKLTLAQVKYLIAGWLLTSSQNLQAVLDGEALFEAIEGKATPEKRADILKWIKNVKSQTARRRIKCRLTVPDIQLLFHAVYEDAGRGKFDPDFQKEPKTLYRLVSRNAALWPGLRKGNKTRAA